MSTVPATIASRASSTQLVGTAASVPALIVGFRREGSTIVLVEPGGTEHRATDATALWKLVGKMLDASEGVTTVAEDSERKRQRADLAKAFGVLAGKARERAAERVGEETVGAVETIAKVAGGSALKFLRRTSVSGGSTVARRYHREAKRSP